MTRTLLPIASLFALAASLSAAPIELRNLTQDAVRAKVKAYLASPGAAQQLAPLRAQVTLKEDQIYFTTANGVPQKLEWRYQTLPAFNKVKAAEIQALVKELLATALVKFEGGLLLERDAQFVLARTSFVAVPGVVPPSVGMKAVELTPKGVAAPARVPVVAVVYVTPGYYTWKGYWAYEPVGYWYYGPTWYWGPYGYYATFQPRFVYYPWQSWTPQYAWQYPWFASPPPAYPWWTHAGLTPNYGYRGY